jgi:hypothetical protein
VHEREGRQAARERAEHWMARAEAAEAALHKSERRRRKEVSTVSAPHLPACLRTSGAWVGPQAIPDPQAMPDPQIRLF